MKKNKLLKSILMLILVVMSSHAYSQERSITGTVTDPNNEPLPGTSVLIKGTNNGTETDFDGNFTITANIGDILVISFVGHKTKEIIVGAESTVTIILEEDSGVLDEVVITGYNSQNRNTLATSVATLDNTVLESASYSNAAQALQGTIAGLRVTNTTGQPGSSPQIILRGGTTFGGGGSPLILIDGVVGDFYALNSDDIETMTVLKDAASTAIYGARAANGVILVTTKTGKNGRSSINYRFKYSQNEERKAPEYVSAADFIKYNRQGVAYYTEVTGRTNFDNGFLHGATAFGTGGNATNSPFTTQFLTPENSHLLDQPGWSTIPDPLDPSKQILFMQNEIGPLIYQDSYAQDHYLSFDGGNEKGTYYLGLGHLDNKGLTLGSGFERYSAKFTGSYEVLKNVKVNSQVLYLHSSVSGTAIGGGNDNTAFQRFQGQANTARIYNNNADGTLSDVLNQGTNSGFGNPLYYADKFWRSNLQQKLTMSVGLEWDIREDLKFNLNASHYAVNNVNESFNKAYLNGSGLNTTRAASASLGQTLQNTLTGTLQYKKTFGESHNLFAQIGAESYSLESFGFNAGTRNSASDLIYTMNAGAEANGIPTSFGSEYAIVSQFGNINYDYDSRYLFGFTIRRDGTSRLFPENRYGVFPGVSGAWNLHNESFYQDSSISNIMNSAKPRISYGVNGNVESVSNFGAFGAYGDQGIYNGSTGYANTSLPTPELVWERSTTLNFGLDAGFFNNRMTLIADYFIRDVKDKLATLTLPYYTGFSGITTNNGTLRNKGIELQINGDIIRNENWTWNLGATLTSVKSYVEALPENDNELNRQGGTLIYDPNSPDGSSYVGGLQEGQRVGSDIVTAYIQDYIYADQTAADVHNNEGRIDQLANNQDTRFPGDVAWKDLNGDNVINSLDRQVIGRTTPDFVGGFTTNLTYKDFNLFVRTDFATGHLIRSNMREKGLAQTQGNLNAYAELLDSWTPENRITDVPRMVFVDPQKNHNRGSSHYWEKGDYLKLGEVTLSYNLPSEYLEKIQLKDLRIYATGQNLLYITEYGGQAPEIGGFQGGRFPVPVTFTLGLNLTL